MKKERSSKVIYARFAIIILVCAALGGVGFPGVPGFCGWGKDEGGGYKKESGHKRDSQEVAFGSQSGEHAGYAPETVSREMGKPDKNLIPAGLR